MSKSYKTPLPERDDADSRDARRPDGRLNRLAYFCAVIEEGSFTAAAERLGLGKAVVSHQVARLEKTLGVTLLLRSTRRLQLTDAGENFYRRAQEILKTANALFDEMADTAREPSGTLRLTMPFDYGTQVIVPVMAAFCERYPRCRVEANFSDTRQDLMSGRHELAIRAGWAVDEQASSRLLGHFRQLLVAPASWRLPAQPDTPAGLTSLPFVANAALRHPNDWCFSRGETRVEVRLAARVSLDSTLAVRAAVLAGVGMAILPDYMVQPALDAGQLQVLLPAWRLARGEIRLMFPLARHRPARVKAFVAMLEASLQDGVDRAQAHQGS